MYVAEGMLLQLSQVRYKNSTADNTTDDAVITVLEDPKDPKDPKWVDYELKSTTAKMHLRIRVEHELGHIRRIHVVEEQTPVQTIKTLRYEVMLLGQILEEEEKNFDIARLKSNIENRIRKINDAIIDAIRKTEKAACDRQHGEWDEEKGQCFFNADGLPLEEPLTGDIIIDPDTGPHYYKHAAVVIEKNRSPAQQMDSTDPNNPFHRNVAVGADMGFDNKGKHQAGFTRWYYHSGVPSTGKVIFRFVPSPEKETAQDKQ